MLRLPGCRAYLAASALGRLAFPAVAVLQGIAVYQLAHDPLALGWMGLAMAVPAIGLVLFGGYIADRYNRRWIVIIATAAITAWRAPKLLRLDIGRIVAPL